jgi:hypothetical protein
MEAPSWGAQARTALALAREGVLVTRGCRTTPTSTTVTVVDPGAGRPVVRLDGAAGLLTGCPVASLTLAGVTDDWELVLVGRFERVRDTDGPTFRPTLLHSVRIVGPACIPVPAEEFLRAAPAPPAIPLACRCHAHVARQS